MFRRSSFAAVAVALAVNWVCARGEAAAGDARIVLAQNNVSRETEGRLRTIIGELQRGAPDAASMEPSLQPAVQAQAGAVAAMLAKLGPLEQIEFAGTENGTDAYAVKFRNGATSWFIRLSPAGKIAGLFFKPIQPPEAAGEEVAVAGLSGTLLKPQGVARPVVVLLIAGSGPTDRNGNQGGTGPGELRQLAEQLAERGLASLRYDKRGIGRSSAAGLREQNLVLGSFVDDAAAWLAWLEQRGDLGPCIVAGHSEGGLIALLLAKRTPVSGIVLLATAGRKLGDLLRDQLSQSGMPEELRSQAFSILAALERGESIDKVDPALLALFRPSVQRYMISELAIDPVKEAKEVAVPMLIVSGGHDLQVSPADAALLSAARPDAARLDIKGMNHVLKMAPADAAGQQDAYTNPSLPLAEGLSDAVASFARRWAH